MIRELTRSTARACLVWSTVSEKVSGVMRKFVKSAKRPLRVDRYSKDDMGVLAMLRCVMRLRCSGRV